MNNEILKKDRQFRRFSIGFVWVWLGVFVLIPSFLLLLTSLLVQGDQELVRLELTLSNYFHLFDIHYLHVFLRSFSLAAICTLICLVLGYPFSYFLVRVQKKYKNILLLLLIIPFWTSSLIRSYAIMAILKTHGLLNRFLLMLGVIDAPVQWLYTHTATLIGLVYTLLPLMILPLYATIEKLDFRLIDAARDLGAKKRQIVLKILLPLTLPGILSGSILVLLPAMTLFYIPDLLGGAKTILIGNMIQNQFLAARNWPMGATVSVALTLLMGILLLIYWRMYHYQSERLYTKND